MRCAGGVAHALPPDVPVVGTGDVREQRVALGDGAHRVRVRGVVGARRDAEQAVLRVHRVQAAVGAVPHPGDVVAERTDVPAGDRRLEHREVRLAAGRRERARDVVDLALGRRQLEDQHVLGEPALVAAHHAGDPQRVALLAEQRVAAVAGPVRPDHPLLGEVRDVLLFVARPRDVFLARFQRRADAVQGRHEHGVVAHRFEDVRTHPGHDLHGQHDVRAVGDLDAEHRALRGQRAHAERDHVHRAAAHAAAVQLGHDTLHVRRRHPVVRRPGILRIDRADERALLDPGHVGRVGPRPERVGLELVVEPDERAGGDESVGESLPLGVRAVDPDDPVGRGEFGYFTNPGEQALMGGRGAVQPEREGGRSCHDAISFGRRRLTFWPYHPCAAYGRLSAVRSARSLPSGDARTAWWNREDTQGFDQRKPGRRPSHWESL